MKKFIFTLLLAIVSSVWTTSMALCLSPIPDAVYQPFATVSGTFASVPIPCEPIDEYPCPACLTLALQTSDRLYYLTADNADIQTQLEAIEYQLSLTTNIKGSVSGTPYTEGSYEYIRVQAVNTNSAPLRLPSLCDEWNVLEISNVTCGYCEEYRTYNFHLTTDTVIGGLLYSQLIKDGAYKGALREGNNRDIYCVPAGCSQEYLLYAFNAQVGDSLKNIWVGGYSSWIPDVRSAIVSEIKQTTPRTIELEVHYYEAPDAYEESIRNLTWIEGIGMPFGPMGAECSVFNGCADSKAKLLLCAYNNGEHIYTSDFGEQYGCEYNYDPFAPSDTIPLYIKDGPGSSTIEPVDPNEIIAKLIHDELQMKEYLHTMIDYNLTKAPAANSSPAVKHVNPVVAADSFTDSETVTLTESGRYFLEMSHPDWDYTIVGTFVYNALQGLETIENSQSACTKELREGQLLIRQGEQLYTPTGIRIQ